MNACELTQLSIKSGAKGRNRMEITANLSKIYGSQMGWIILELKRGIEKILGKRWVMRKRKMNARKTYIFLEK